MRHMFAVLMIGMIAIFFISFQPAFSSGSVQIDWWSLDAGGGTMTNGVQYLDGTTGQPDPQVMTNQSYQLEGGFWITSVSTAKYSLYVPVTVK